MAPFSIGSSWSTADVHNDRSDRLLLDQEDAHLTTMATKKGAAAPILVPQDYLIQASTCFLRLAMKPTSPSPASIMA